MKRSALVLSVVLGALLLVPTSSGAAKGFHSCGDMRSQFVFSVRADFKCKKAKRVVRTLDWEKSVYTPSARGFKCKISKTDYDGSWYKCKNRKRTKQVRFYRGG